MPLEHIGKVPKTIAAFPTLSNLNCACCRSTKRLGPGRVQGVSLPKGARVVQVQAIPKMQGIYEMGAMAGIGLEHIRLPRLHEGRGGQTMKYRKKENRFSLKLSCKETLRVDSLPPDSISR